MFRSRYILKLSNPFVFMIIFFFTNCGVKDIRPTSLKTQKPIQSIERLTNSEILGFVDPSHLFESWSSYSRLEMRIEDEWSSGFLRSFTILTENKSEMKLILIPKTGDMEIEFLNGKRKGEIFGIQNGKSYKGKTKDDYPSAKLYLESLSLYLRLSYLINSFSISKKIEEKYISKKNPYHQIFATSKSLEPSSDVDQYVFLIDPDTKLISHILFTYREVFQSYQGNLALEKFKKFGKLLFPSQISITDDPEDSGFTHRINIFELGFVP